MDPGLIAGIAAVVGLVAAGGGLYAMAYAMGFFQYLGGKKRPSMPPVSRQDLIEKLLALDDPERPYRIARGLESDLVAEWKIVDAQWYGIFNKSGLKEAYRALLLADEDRHSVRCFEGLGTVTWTAGGQPAIAQRQLFGEFLSRPDTLQEGVCERLRDKTARPVAGREGLRVQVRCQRDTGPYHPNRGGEWVGMGSRHCEKTRHVQTSEIMESHRHCSRSARGNAVAAYCEHYVGRTVQVNPRSPVARRMCEAIIMAQIEGGRDFPQGVSRRVPLCAHTVREGWGMMTDGAHSRFVRVANVWRSGAAIGTEAELK